MFHKSYFPGSHFHGSYFPPAVGTWAGTPENLGRFRAGEWVTIEVAGGTDAVPEGRYFTSAPDAPAIVFSPTRSGAFRARIRVAGFPGLGTFVVEVSRAVAGVTSRTRHSFTIVGGGDSGGRVVSLASAERPGGPRVLAHLDSGLMVQGNSPRI